MVVNFQTVDGLGWTNTFMGLSVPFLATAFGIFLLRQVFMTLPRDLRDAAAIDGVGHWGFMRHVAVPLVRPTIGALALFSFLGTWNQYLWPNLVVTEQDMNTVQSGLRLLSKSNVDQPNLVMAGTVIAAVPDLHRPVRLPAPARPGPHRGRGEGMTRRSPSRLRVAPRPRRDRRARRADRAACGSGKSALQAGMDDPADRRSRRPRWPRRRSDGSEPSGSDPTVTRRHDAGDHRSDDDRGTARRPARRARPTRSTRPSGPVDITFWHGLANESEASLIALTDAYNASQDRVHVDLQNQTSYDSAIDKYIQSSQDSRPTVVQFPEYTLQSFAESGHVDPDRGVPRVERLRHVGVRAAHARRLHVRGHPVVDAVQRQQPGAVLQPHDVRGRPVSIRRSARSRSTSCAPRRRRSSTAGPRRTDGSSTPDRTRAAVGSSSSGSVAPASSTPTTATAASPRRPRCCTTERPASSCSRSCSR